MLAKRGISRQQLERLRLRHRVLDRAMETADTILEERYIRVPAYKMKLQKHMDMMLKKSIGGNWSDRSTVDVQVHQGDIFSSLETTPIISIKDCGRVTQSYELIGSDARMEPDSRATPTTDV